MTTINQWGFGEASAGSAVGLRSVYDWLHLLKKSLGAECVYRLPSLNSLSLLLWFLWHAGQGLSDLLSCGLCKVQQDHMKARV